MRTVIDATAKILPCLIMLFLFSFWFVILILFLCHIYLNALYDKLRCCTILHQLCSYYNPDIISVFPPFLLRCESNQPHIIKSF